MRTKPSYHFIILMISFILIFEAAIPAVGQTKIDTTTASDIITNTTLSVNRPIDMFEEWWLYLKSGKTIFCNRTDITPTDDELRIVGTLRSLQIPRSEVTTILIKTGTHRFRDGFIFGAYFGSAFFLSPARSPGYFIGTSNNFPGLDAGGIVLALLLAGAAGALNATTSSNTDILSLDGTESERAWELIVEPPQTHFHFRGFLAYAHSSAQQEWKNLYASLGATERKSDEDDLSSINILRFISATFTISKKFEFGLGIQTGGEPQFHSIYKYYTSGNPPQTIEVELGNQYRASGYYLLLNYLPQQLASREVSMRFGMGVGLGSYQVIDDNNYYWSQITPGFSNSFTRASATFQASIDYAIDQNLSIGLSADYTFHGILAIPPQTITPSYPTSPVKITLPGTEVNMNSYGIGISFGLHY